jgi:hypothetical protein
MWYGWFDVESVPAKSFTGSNESRYSVTMRTAAVVLTVLVGLSDSQMRNIAIDNSQLLKQAKKVVVFINLENPAAAPYRPDYDRAKKQVSEKLGKQRLQVVASPEQADIVIVVREFNATMGATAQATTYGQSTTATAKDLICLGDELKVFRGGKTPSDSDAPIYSVSEVCGFSWPLNRAMDKFAKARKEMKQK